MELSLCMEYATQMHAGQTRKQGTPYIEHPLWVMNYLRERGYDEATQAAGVFHDLLEDTAATDEDILRLSCDRTLEAVRLVTKFPGYDTDVYFAKILDNPMAKAVKAADRIHNLKSMAELPAEDARTKRFVRKYIEETGKYFLGRFGAELDEEYNRACLYFADMLDAEKSE